MKTFAPFKKAMLGAAALCAIAATPAAAQDISACLITKTDTNPFFVKMREGAEAKAKDLGITLNSYAGKVDGDNETQVAAIETCIANGAKGILLTPSSTSAIVPSVQQARDGAMAAAMLEAGDAGAILIAGAGHVREDRAAPAILERKAPSIDVLTIGLMELGTSTDIAGYLEDTRFDYIVLTPKADMTDHCAEMKKSMEASKPKP